MPPAKFQTGRTPVHRFLIVALDSRFARHILPVREVRHSTGGQSAELISEISEEPRIECVPPVHRGVDPSGIAGVQKTENVRAVRARALITEATGELILPSDGFVETRLQ